MSEHLIYSALCPIGIQRDRARSQARNALARVAIAFQDDEDNPRLAASLETLKAKFKESGIELSRHVGHCSDGCQRRSGQEAGLHSWRAAPSLAKPELPPMSEIAARLREGEALDAIATEYDRSPLTLVPRLKAAGFSPVDGRALVPPPKVPRLAPLLTGPEEPWRADALCAQVDPEAFFPKQGGTVREAKKVCGECGVREKCLQDALDNQVRFGVWGGLSGPERRKLLKAGAVS